MDKLLNNNLIGPYLRDLETEPDTSDADDDLLDVIASRYIEDLPAADRNRILRGLKEYRATQPIFITYDPSRSTWQSICDLLDEARENSKDGPVAQYLVGAKLQLRFPEIEISNESFSTADVQLGRHGDFYVGNTIFHVTVSPMSALYEKCKRNLKDGFKVYLLVRNKDVVGTKQNAENIAAGQIVVESIETFVGQNLDELAAFSKDKRASGFRELLETYNRRVDATEMNKSLMIEIPPKPSLGKSLLGFLEFLDSKTNNTESAHKRSKNRVRPPICAILERAIEPEVPFC